MRYLVGLGLVGLVAWWLFSGRNNDAPVPIAAKHVDPRPHAQTVVPTTAIVGRVMPAVEGAVVTARDHETHVSAKTDAGGTFEIPTQPGTYVIAAQAHGYLPAIVHGGTKAPVELDLVSGGFALSGTITDVTGGTVEGAKLALDFDGADLVAFSDPEGHYRLSLPMGAYSLDVTHEDYVAQQPKLEIGDAPRTFDLALTPAATVQGVVLERASGAPIAEAVVEIDSRHGFGGSSTRVTSDERGRFIARVDPGQLELTARGRGFASTTTVELAIGGLETRDNVELRLDPAFGIRGRVVDENGSGLAHAAISLDSHDATTSDGSGMFALEGLSAGSHYVEAKLETLETAVETYEMRHGDVVDAVLVMRPKSGFDASHLETYEVSGRIEPATAADVEFDSQHTRTDAKGRFSVPEVTWQRGTMLVRTDDGRVGLLEISEGQSTRGLVVHVGDASRVNGKVVDESGAPLAGRVVTAQSRRDPVQRTTTDALGHFAFANLFPGEVDVGTEDSLDWERRARDGAILVDTRTQRGEVTLHARSYTETLRGIVRDDRGTPVAGARVESLDKAPTFTAVDGTFVVRDVSKSFVPNVTVWAPKGDGYADVKGTSYDVPLEITLTRWYPLEGTVRKADMPIGDFYIACGSETTFLHRYKHVVSLDGHFVLPPVAPGLYSCEVRSAVGPATGSIEVKNGPTDLALEVPHDLVVRGKLVSVLTGIAVVGAHIRAPGANEDVESDMDGRFEVHQVPLSGTLEFFGDGVRGKCQFSAHDGELVDLGTIAIIARPPGTERGVFQIELAGMNGTIDAVGPVALAAGLEKGDVVVTIDGVTIPPDLIYHVFDEGLVYQHAYQLGLARGISVTLTASEYGYWHPPRE